MAQKYLYDLIFIAINIGLLFVEIRDVGADNSCPSPCAQSNNWSSNIGINLPFPTPGPVNFDTRNAKVINFTGNPLTINVNNEATLYAINTGSSLILEPADSSLDYATIVGGILGKGASYIFNQVQFFWNQDPCQSCCSTFGFPAGPALAFSMYFINSKYPSVKVAVTKRDGFAVLMGGTWPQGYSGNSHFTNFEAVLNNLHSPGSQNISLGDSMGTWLEQFSSSCSYFAYPAAYVTSDSVVHFASTFIFPRLSVTSSLSIPEFQAFTKVANSKGTPLDTTLPSYAPYNCFPLVEGGTIQFNTLL